jgi:outer membrane protein assembly factor BamE (lipoprotein component of BamABCDE complex)
VRRALRRGALAFTLALLASGPGCVTFIHATQGNRIDPDQVAQLERGRTTLPEVLGLLGAPLEVHQHAEGQLLVYRHRGRNTFRLGLSASQALRFVDATQVVSEALSNLQFTLERVHADEDRVVILFDREGVVQAVGAREGTHDLATF